MRKLIGILLIFTLVGSYSGTYLWLRIQKKKVKREVKIALATINKEKLVTLIFSENKVEKLDWKNPHEFQHEGRMYDVIEVSYQKGKAIYTCWLDKEETRLNNKLKTLVNRIFSSELPVKKSSEKVFSFFKQLYHYLPKSVKWKEGSLISNTILSVTVKLKMLYHSPPSPPPEVSFY